MTVKKSNTMVELKKDAKLRTLRSIIASLRSLEQGTSTSVYKYIVDAGEQKRDPPTEEIGFSGLEISRFVKEQRGISKRTIQRNLKELIERGLVKRVGKFYKVSDSIRANRFVGSDFGASVLFNLIPQPNFQLKTVKENLNELIRLFGTILIFCFMEAARPKKNNDTEDQDHSGQKQLMSTMSWINSVISPSSLFHYFLFVFKNQIDDEMINKLTRITFYGQKRGKSTWLDEKGREYHFRSGMSPRFINEKGKPYRTGLYRDIPFHDGYLHMDRFHVVYTDYDPPLDEVSSRTYLKLVEALRESIPDLSLKLEELRTNDDHARYFLEDTK